MNQLAAICVKRPVFATVLILVLVVFGVFGYLKLGIDRFPKIDFPMVTVTTRQPGAAPEEIETGVTQKIEDAVSTVNGIEELRSISSEGVSQVFIQFALEKDVDIAAQDVRDKINRVVLDPDVKQPIVEKLDLDAIAVVTIAISAPPPATLRDITEYADKVLRRQLQTINGVGDVMIVGGQARQINVVLDPLKLRAQRLTVVDVARAVGAQNLQMPSGSMKVGPTEYTLRTMGRVNNMREMEAITVANRDGRTITVGDLGHAEDSTEEMQSSSLYNDTPCVQLNIRKQSGTNTVEVARLVKERLKELTALAPKGYSIEVVRDQSVFIEASVDTVKEHLMLGGLLAAVVVFVFLANFRATLIAALSIPASIVAAFAIVRYMGFTLNSMSLLALTLSVGIVIDDAIVVMENIFRYIEEKGCSPHEAAIRATSEIGLAVLAITLSLIAVFLPIAMMEGIVGRFLYCFGITMAATILVSMLVSFTLTPMLAARWFKAKAAGHGGGSKNQPIYHAIEWVYLAVLRFSLRQRWLVVVAAIGACVMGVLLIRYKMIAMNFLPDDDSSEFQVNVQAPEGTSLEATQVLIARIAREIRRLDGVQYTISSVADTDQRNHYQGTAYVRLVTIAERSFDEFQIMDYVRKNILPKYAADKLRLSVTPVSLISLGGVQADVQYMIGGPDVKKLEQYAASVMADLRKVPGARDVDSSISTGKPQYGVRIDRAKAAELGVEIADAANTLRLLVAGGKVSDYYDKGEQYEVHVRSVADVRNRLDELKMVTVPSNKGGKVPLGDIVRFDPGTGPAQINRFARTRQVTINANLAPGASQQIIQDELEKSVAGLQMGPDYKTGLMGRSKEMAKMQRAFMTAFAMAFIFVYLCLAAQFESWLHPITILLSLPLTVPFALLSLFILHQSINIFSLLGILVLFAVVKKNAILQIDHTNQLRAAGMPKFEAMVAANRDRLRPILMTTVAFVAGMVPTLVSNAEGSAVNKAISGVIIGGQSLSLLLTLLAVPVAYSLFDDLSVFIGWLFGRQPAGVARDVERASEQEEAASQAARSTHPATPAGDGRGNGDSLRIVLDETISLRREPSHPRPAEPPVRHGRE